MEDFFIKNASAVFSLCGAIFGIVFTGIINYISKTKESKLRLTERLLDKKLMAHESLINIANLIRTVISIGGLDSDGQLKRLPRIMYNQENMDQFQNEFAKFKSTSDRWFSSGIQKEVNFFFDYFLNLKEWSNNSSNNSLHEVGFFIIQDFIDLASNLDNCAHQFCNEELLRLNYKTDRKWHKYPKEETHKKLNNTLLFKHKKEILALLNSKQANV